MSAYNHTQDFLHPLIKSSLRNPHFCLYRIFLSLSPALHNSSWKKQMSSSTHQICSYSLYLYACIKRTRRNLPQIPKVISVQNRNVFTKWILFCIKHDRSLSSLRFYACETMDSPQRAEDRIIFNSQDNWEHGRAALCFNVILVFHIKKFHPSPLHYTHYSFILNTPHSPTKSCKPAYVL